MTPNYFVKGERIPQYMAECLYPHMTKTGVILYANEELVVYEDEVGVQSIVPVNPIAKGETRELFTWKCR